MTLPTILQAQAWLDVIGIAVVLVCAIHTIFSMETWRMATTDRILLLILATLWIDP